MLSDWNGIRRDIIKPGVSSHEPRATSQTVARSPRSLPAFVILMRAQNPPQRMGTDAGCGCPSSCDLSASESLLLLMGCGRTAAGGDVAGAFSGDSATSAKWE